MKIEIPTNCPSCNSELVNINGQLFCKNKTGCSAQSSKKVENFCKKMKIKGFGAKTIEKLSLSSVVELITIEKMTLVETLGEKIGNKLFGELDKVNGCEFGQFLGSLSIPLIGATAAEKVATKASALHELSPELLKEVGLGAKASQNLLDWMCSEEAFELLDLRIEFAEPVELQEFGSDLPAVDVCITGKLEDFRNRTLAADYLAQWNVTVKKSVTKTVQYLVCEDDSKIGSSSYKKAEANGIEILSIKQLIKQLEQ